MSIVRGLVVIGGSAAGIGAAMEALDRLGGKSTPSDGERATGSILAASLELLERRPGHQAARWLASPACGF